MNEKLANSTIFAFPCNPRSHAALHRAVLGNALGGCRAWTPHRVCPFMHSALSLQNERGVLLLLTVFASWPFCWKSRSYGMKCLKLFYFATVFAEFGSAWHWGMLLGTLQIEKAAWFDRTPKHHLPNLNGVQEQFTCHATNVTRWWLEENTLDLKELIASELELIIPLRLLRNQTTI